MENRVYLTPEGKEKLQQELDHLVNVKRLALAERLHHAIQQGDLSENADYQTAKEEQGFLEGRIQQLEGMLLDAVIIQQDQRPKHMVDLGSRVTVIEEGEDGPETFFIVGAAESDPSDGRISNESPLGRALIKHKIGERVTVHTPSGEIVFEIVALD
jgi:transcription elongation factor GreA